MKKYKYLLNYGLEFDEERLIKKLNKLAKEGWILKEMNTFHYKLEKETPQDLQYTMDFKNFDSESEEEYLEMIEASGWKCMCSYKGYYFFASQPGTTKIYTDSESYLEKYKDTKVLFKKDTIYSAITLVLLLMINNFVASDLKNGVYGFFFVLILGCSVGALVPSIMVLTSQYFREKNILNKKFNN